MALKNSKMIRRLLLLSLLVIVFSAGYLLHAFSGKLSKPGSEVSLESPHRGPDSAPVTITEFADFYCPYCGQAAGELNQVIAEYPEEVKWVFKHFPLSDDPSKGSFPVHLASACAQEQNEFWAFHNLVFKMKKRLSLDEIENLAKQLNLNMNQFRTCMEEKRYVPWILSQQREGTEKGVTGTPKFFVNQYEISGAYPADYFKQVIESILNPEENKPPVGIKEYGKEVNIDFGDMTSFPYQGNRDASVVIVEFSDYHCPFCRKLDATLQEAVDKRGADFKRIFRHFPLDMHPDADEAHAAAECAHRQNSFWPYHARLFEMSRNQQSKQAYINLAGELGLKTDVFEACLESEEVMALIDRDVQAALQAGVRGTPTLFINGKKRSGAMPLQTLEALIDAELKG